MEKPTLNAWAFQMVAGGGFEPPSLPYEGKLETGLQSTPPVGIYTQIHIAWQAFFSFDHIFLFDIINPLDNG